MADGYRFPYAGNIHSRKFQHPTERVKNQFANDGSFLEMFKKRMEEQMKTDSAKISADDGVNSNIKNTTTAVTSTSNKKIMLSAGLSPDNLSNINNTRATTTTTTTTTTSSSSSSTTNPLKSGLLPLVRFFCFMMMD